MRAPHKKGTAPPSVFMAPSLTSRHTINNLWAATNFQNRISNTPGTRVGPGGHPKKLCGIPKNKVGEMQCIERERGEKEEEKSIC